MVHAPARADISGEDLQPAMEGPAIREVSASPLTVPAMLVILTADISPRHRYIFGYLLRIFCGVDCSFRDLSEDRSQPTGVPVIAYTEDRVEGAFHIRPQGILSRTGIPEEPSVVDRSGRLPFFYPCPDADFPFDVFGAAFYLLSRAEEYHGHAPDPFGRYHHIHSLAYRNDFLDLPLIDGWMADLRQALIRTFPSVSFKAPAFEFRPTYDVDLAWAFRSRGIVRTIGGLLKSLSRLHFRDFCLRLKVLSGLHQDPFDAYDRLERLHHAYGLKPVHFFLLASKVKGVDRNISPQDKDLSVLIERHARQYPVGMHPSWQSGDDPAIFQGEKDSLEGMIGREVTMSRQHYLRMQLPDTYRRLIDHGITADHSMGYGSANGFRASVSRSFPWYDLLEERETSLMVHPFCFMDATAFHELGMYPQEAFRQMEGYLQVIRESGGSMMTIFHNSMLGTDKLYKGWYEMYVRFLDRVTGHSTAS
jgi:hypothetical protein